MSPAPAEGADRFIADAVAAGHVIPAHHCTTSVSSAGPSGVVFREVQPFVSYPHEWTFGMLQDAALLLLGLLRAGLADGMMCTSGSALDVQFYGARPVMVGLGAFRPRLGAEPWPGYRAFCRTFLYPLLVTARCGIPFQPLLRCSPTGIGPATAARLLSLSAPSLETVPSGTGPIGLVAQAGKARWLDEYAATVEPPEVTASRLQELVRALEPGPAGSGAATPVRDRAAPFVAEARDRFVAETLSRTTPARVLDLSCGDGRYARAAADRSAAVVALDADAGTVEHLYRSLRDGLGPAILPLVAGHDGLDRPSPWDAGGRLAVADRIRPRLVLYLDPVLDDVADAVELLGCLDAPVVTEVPHDAFAAFAHHARRRFRTARHRAVPLPGSCPCRHLLELVPTVSLP